ncbi:hypothetical protein ACN47E_002771 [Coniothyrium glycines]
MQSLTLPRPSSLLSTPSGRPDPEDGLAKFRSKFSPTRPEQQSYPSPPMSEPHSPTRRPAQTSEAARSSYPPPADATHRVEAGLPLPHPSSSSSFDLRSLSSASSSVQQRPLYPGEAQHRARRLDYQSSRAIEQHAYNNASMPQHYGYAFSNHALPPYPGAQHTGPMGQQAAMIAPPPARPSKPARRTKAHVASACVNCKKAHLSCDVQRPCGRCVASGKQDTCKDVQHKKRGRPRLRDDREFSRSEEGGQQTLSGSSSSGPFAPQASFVSSHAQRVPDLPRTGSTAHSFEGRNVGPQATASPNGVLARNLRSHSDVAPLYPAGPSLGYQSLPVAFLNLDLVIQKSNQAFSELVSFLGDVKGKHLGELLEVRQNESLQRLRNELRDERDEREPTYMAPITSMGLDPMRAAMDSVTDQDVDQVTHGFTDRPMFLSFRLPSGGQYQSLQVQIRLAKTSLYFITLVVRSPPRLAGPPLLTQQPAPPTPQGKSQARPAPSTTPASHFTPLTARPQSSTGSTPGSPYFNFSSVRTSLPTFSPGSYSSSPSYGYSPSAGPDSGYFPTIQPPSQPTTGAYPSPYSAASRSASVASGSLREINRPARLEGLHLPPIRTGPAPLGSPLHVETNQGVSDRERVRVRPREYSSSAEQRRPETPETGKRRRLKIHEVLE